MSLYRLWSVLFLEVIEFETGTTCPVNYGGATAWLTVLGVRDHLMRRAKRQNSSYLDLPEGASSRHDQANSALAAYRDASHKNTKTQPHNNNGIKSNVPEHGSSGRLKSCGCLHGSMNRTFAICMCRCYYPIVEIDMSNSNTSW